jgi:hypothetical protein
MRWGSGFVSFHHQAKIVRKTLIPTVLWLLYDFLSLKNDVTVASKSNKLKNLEEEIIFSCHLEDHWRKQEDPEPDLDPLARDTDERIRIRIKMSWIRKNALSPTVDKGFKYCRCWWYWLEREVKI